jgi:lysophospholipase L1-like esterase
MNWIARSSRAARVERAMSHKAMAESFRQQVEDQKTQVENLKSALLRLQQKLTAHFGFANVRNRGADATNSYEALERLNRNLNKDAYGLILYGTNDWNIPGCQTDPAVCPTVENLRILVQRVKAEGTLPFIATITPANPAINDGRNTWIVAINTGIKAMAAQEGAFLVDLYQAFQNQGGDLSRFFADQVHPNAAGYDVMANGFFEAIAHGRSTP